MKSERPFFIPRLIVYAAMLAVGPWIAARGASKPNILYLIADDQRADTIAAHGNRFIKTPNLDRLVENGFSFRGNYCFGGNSGAVCIPSRAMLMKLLMKQWQTRTGDKLELPSRTGQPAIIDLTGKKRTPDQWQPDWIIQKYF